jgi:beta-glucosidase
VDPDGRVEVKVTVANTGQRAGDEVVQIYVQDVAGSVTRPVKQLAGFSRVTLQPGDSRALAFTLDRTSLGVWHERDGRMIVEPGQFRVWAATSSAGGLEASFEVK